MGHTKSDDKWESVLSLMRGLCYRPEAKRGAADSI